MAFWDLFKHPQQRALEDQARLNRAYAELGWEVPNSARLVTLRKGVSEDARARAFGADLVRRVGPSEASRLADLVVSSVQMASRGRE